jgi:3-oxoadipate enol-lactonase
VPVPAARPVPTSAGSLQAIDTADSDDPDSSRHGTTNHLDEAFVFLHGNLSRGSHWAPQIERLGDEVRCIAPDQRGFGDSPVDAPPSSLLAMAGDVVDLCAALGVTRAHVVGLSMGGVVAQAVALAAPRLVATLTLASTYRVDDPLPSIAAMLAGTVDDVPPMEALAPVLPAATFSASFRDEHPDVVEAIVGDFLATPRATLLATVSTSADAPEVVASRIVVPTLVIGATEDPTSPPEVTRHLADAIPGARYELLKAGHLVNVEAPDDFTALIRDHASV